MSTLLLVRHGESSGYGLGPIRLTPAGLRQAAALGRHWAQGNIRPRRVYAGPAERHLETAQGVAEAFAAAGRLLPEAEVVAALDEFPAVEVCQRGLPVLRESDQQLRAWTASTAEGGAPPEAQPSFAKIYGRVVRLYAQGSLALEGVTPFRRFRQIVDEWLVTLSQQGERGVTVAAFTSAGTVAAAVGMALDLSDEKTMELALVAANTGVTELRYTRGMVSLISFNLRAHLDKAHNVGESDNVGLDKTAANTDG